MKKMRAGQVALFAVLIPIWVVCFALSAREVLRGGPYQTPIVVQPGEGADGYPVVARHRPGAPAPSDGAQVGDRLVRIGGVDLRGAMPWTVYAQLFAQASGASVPIALERDGRPIAATLHLLSEADHAWQELAVALAFVVTAVLILLRASGSRMVQSFALATLVWTVTALSFWGPSPAQSHAYFVIRAMIGCLWAPLMVRAAYHFPDGAWPRDVRTPLWPWAFAVLGLTWTSKWAGLPFSVDIGTRANPLVGSLVIATILVLATRNYRRAGALGQRQVRWVLLGAYLGMAPAVAGNLTAAFRPELAPLWYASQVCLIAIPISIFIGVTRSNLLDVDRLISGTASYTLLLVVLGAGALTVVPWLADEASARAGIDPTLVQVGAGAILALCAMRVEPTVRPFFERAFFAERQALQSGIDHLVADLGAASDATSLTRMVGERLDDLLKPACCVIYARSEEAYAPVFARGAAVTPHFDLESPVLSALAERSSAVDLERGGPLAESGSAEDQASMGSLAAAVLLPVSRNRELVAFVVLGRKGSGDIYTPMDLALLGVVGAQLSASLTRFGDEELLNQAHDLQEKLRQYVPASIAAQLVEGRDLESGEREVSVLFADLRGYTSLAEGQGAEEIFTAVSRYTETVTRVVTAHGGTVVEFNGDGMMAVFGAPDHLPEKERRALDAARQIVDEVGALVGLGDDASAGNLDVGVGVATGPAYVGAIRSVDRYIWSAIGNTTNLAARLQSLTKDFGAPIVIDDATHAAAGGPAADFDQHPETSIRGLREARDLFSLSRARLVAA